MCRKQWVIAKIAWWYLRKVLAARWHRARRPPRNWILRCPQRLSRNLLVTQDVDSAQRDASFAEVNPSRSLLCCCLGKHIDAEGSTARHAAVEKYVKVRRRPTLREAVDQDGTILRFVFGNWLAEGRLFYVVWPRRKWPSRNRRPSLCRWHHLCRG